MGEEGEIAHVLVVDDDDRLRSLLSRLLRESGFCPSVVDSASQARQALQAFMFDLVVLDVMMPGESGLDFLKNPPPLLPPLLLLTAQGGVEERIEGLSLGADDYLAKPFDPRELVLRMRGILRRSRGAEVTHGGGGQGVFGPFVFNMRQQSLTKNGEFLHVTPNESKLLTLFLRAAHKTLSREDIAAALGEGVSLRAVDVQINRLRQKIEHTPSRPFYLQSVRGQGYCMRIDG